MIRRPLVRFGDILKPVPRPYQLGADEDANLVGMRLYGLGPFHRELKPATKIVKKSHFVIRTGDIIYNKLFAWKGTFGVVPPNLDGMFVSDKFPTYTLDRTRANLDFMRWYFRYPPLWKQAEVMSTGSAALSKFTLNPPKFLLLTLFLPSFAEQAAIARKLDEASSRISEVRTLTSQIWMEVRALLPSTIGGLTADLKVDGSLGDVLLSPPRNGISLKRDGSPEGTPVLSLGAVTGFRYKSTEYKRTSEALPQKAYFWLSQGDLLITRSNTPDLVGHAAIYDGSPSPCIYPDLMMRLEVNKALVDPRFLLYWLQSPFVRDFIRSKAKGTSASMKKISQKNVMAIPFPRSASLAQQLRIVSALDSLAQQRDLLTTLEAESASEIKALLPSILHDVFAH